MNNAGMWKTIWEARPIFKYKPTILFAPLQSPKSQASDLENLHRVDFKEEPARLDIRVVQGVQPFKALSINLGVKYSKRLDDMAYL
jgi:hypothetical protein